MSADNVDNILHTIHDNQCLQPQEEAPTVRVFYNSDGSMDVDRSSRLPSQHLNSVQDW